MHQTENLAANQGGMISRRTPTGLGKNKNAASPKGSGVLIDHDT
jgi:hypothetical protein